MRCALVNLQTGMVVNLIMADPAIDPAPAGMLIVALAEGSPVAIGWLYADGNFSPPA